MNGKHIIVTGGAGFIGTNLVRKLCEDNHVTVVDNLHTGSVENIRDLVDAGKVKFVEGDVKNLRKLGIEADVVFHLGIYSASPMYRKNPQLVSEVVAGTIDVLEYAKERGARLVYASTSSIYNSIEPPHREDIIPLVTDFYTEARLAGERLLELYSKLYGIDAQAVRFFSVYGKYEKAKAGYANLATQFLLAMKHGKQPEIYGDGTQRRDFIYAEDLADLLIAASSRKGFNIYNAGTGKNYDLNELVDMINRMLGEDIRPKYLKMPVSNYVMVTLADTTKIRKELGFEAKTSLEKGLDIINKFYS